METSNSNTRQHNISRGAVPGGMMEGSLTHSNENLQMDTMGDMSQSQMNMTSQMIIDNDNLINSPAQNKEQMKSALKDLKDNYKYIELEIEQTTKKQRDHQQQRYLKQMEKIESLKQSLKTEVLNRKEIEEQFMSLVQKRAKEIET